MTDLAFVVRTLPTPGGLKGAFRIHLAPDALVHLRLKVGDICTIVGEDGTRGAGIAWRAADKMGNAPKIQPAKMSEVLRDAYGFKQGTQVRIEGATNGLQPATRISLTEITPVDYEGAPDDDRWKVRCSATLASSEAIAVGTTFDVNAGEGIKKRYFVENIDVDSPEAPFLAYLSDQTDLQILDASLHLPATVTTTQRPLRIDTAYIGGLSDQIKKLNVRLRILCSDAQDINRPAGLACNQSALVYGYQGTGKSLLLSSMEKVHGLNKIIRINGNQLLSTPSKNESIIKSTVQEALASQPSLILVDDIHKAASATDAATKGTASAFAEAFDKVRDARVLIIATARSIADVHSDLLDPGRLDSTIELPIPDAIGRQHILKTLLASERFNAAELASRIAGLTHGYTGSDLARLVKTALFNAFERLNPEDDEWISIWQPDRTSTRLIAEDTAEGRKGSIASTLVEHSSTHNNLLVIDFETALQEIRPSALREIIVEPPKVTFNDIGGSSALQARFDRIITWPTLYHEMMAALPEKKPRRGILLYGPPGCSKTMTAQAVACTYGWNFLAIKGAELISMYVGESERAVREIFRKARQAAPTIIFFDEIDSIATARTGSTDASKSLNVLTTLLNEMDGFEATKHVLVLAATNRPEALDSAILRAGRFDEHIYLGPPDNDARREILRLCTKNAPGAVDVEPLIVQSDGMSGAEIKKAWSLACDIALERAILGQGQAALNVTTQDVEAGIAKTTRVITKEMLQAYEVFGSV